MDAAARVVRAQLRASRVVLGGAPAGRAAGARAQCFRVDCRWRAAHRFDGSPSAARGFQEAPDELVSRQRHHLVAGGPLDPIVLAIEGDAVLVGGQQPAIGDRDAVGVVRQMAQHLPGPGERLVGVEDRL
jgi:hypothetical protein